MTHEHHRSSGSDSSKEPPDSFGRAESEFAAKLDQAVVGILVFIARFMKTLCLVAFRPSRIGLAAAESSVSSPYTFLALGGLLSTRSLRLLLLICVLITSAFRGCSRADTKLDTEFPTLQDLTVMPTMLEFLLVGVPLVGLAVGLAAAFAYALSKAAAKTRVVILPAACYALGFQFFVMGLLLIPLIVLLRSGGDIPERLSYPIVGIYFAIIIGWPGLVFARLVLLRVPKPLWRIKRNILRIPTVVLVSIAVAALMAGGGFLLSQPFHVDDIRTNRDKFARPVLMSQVLNQAIENNELKVTLLVTNDARGILVLTSPSVIMKRNRSVISPVPSQGASAPSDFFGDLQGRIVGMDGPITFAKGQTTALRLSFSLVTKRLDSSNLITFEGAYANSSAPEPDHAFKSGSITTAPQLPE